MKGAELVVFKTERCVLSLFQESDSREVSALFSNPQVRKYLGGERKPDAIEEILSEMLTPEKGASYWAIRERSSNEFIGLISLDPHHDGMDHELSYQLLPKWWGRGYAAEAAAAIVDYALRELQLPAIVAETQSANEPSCRLLEKLGMKLEKKMFRFGAEQSVYAIRSTG